LFAHRVDLGRHLGNGREVFGLAAGQVDAVDVPIFVAAGVLNVQHVLTVVGPEVSANAAVLVVGDWLGGRRIVDGPDKDVQHAVARGEVADLAAIGTDACRGLVGIAEQDGT